MSLTLSPSLPPSLTLSPSPSPSPSLSLSLSLSLGIHANGANWGDDGYTVDSGGEADGSSIVNTWRLAMGAELSQTE